MGSTSDQVSSNIDSLSNTVPASRDRDMGTSVGNITPPVTNLYKAYS